MTPKSEGGIKLWRAGIVGRLGGLWRDCLCASKVGTGVVLNIEISIPY